MDIRSMRNGNLLLKDVQMQERGLHTGVIAEVANDIGYFTTGEFYVGMTVIFDKAESHPIEPRTVIVNAAEVLAML